MSLEALTSQLEEEIQDVEEETFLLFSQPIPSQNLGFIDPKADSLDLTVAGRDFTIHQSPGVLSSTRAGGTTGAVLWKITPLFASFISSPSNPLRTSHVLSPSSSVLELGCGISPLSALTLSPHVASYTLTDQPYVQKLVNLNFTENQEQPQQHKKRRHHSGGNGNGNSGSNRSSNIAFKTLDWETDEVTPSLSPSPSGDFDLVLACDCVYNDALVAPLVQTCVDVCRLRAGKQNTKPCICLVAQQLRSDDVLLLWMTEFHKRFRVWRFPNRFLPEGLRPEDGFVIHVGILRE